MKNLEEIIDLWHFLIQLSIEAGFEPQTLISKYMEKNKENTGRQTKRLLRTITTHYSNQIKFANLS